MSHHPPALEYQYLIHRTIVGAILLVRSPYGICSIYLGDTEADLLKILEKHFHSVSISRASERDTHRLVEWLEQLLGPYAAASPEPLDMRGTAFQRKVWNHLMTIPRGETRTYSQVAQAIGQPKATRAVARACASNEISLAIPCHRVIHANGAKTGYRWGAARKLALLELEKQ